MATVITGREELLAFEWLDSDGEALESGAATVAVVSHASGVREWLDTDGAWTTTETLLTLTRSGSLYWRTWTPAAADLGRQGVAIATHATWPGYTIERPWRVIDTDLQDQPWRVTGGALELLALGEDVDDAGAAVLRSWPLGQSDGTAIDDTSEIHRRGAPT